MTSLYLRLAAYVVAAGLFFGIGWRVGGLGPKASLAALQAQAWQVKQQATAAALAATTAQLQKLQAVSVNNSATIQGLQDENAKIAADRDANVALAQRLLNSAARATSSGSGSVSETKGGQPAPAAGRTSGNGSAAGLLADAAAECQRNADRLDAVSAEIIPQLGP